MSGGILRPYHLQPGPQRALYKINEQEFYYADVFMQKEGQDEDLMSEAHVRSGFVFPAILKNETPSAYDVIQETLSSSLGNLASFGKDIIQQQYSIALPSKSVFQVPERIFMKDSNKESWMEDLSNSQKPLSEVALSKIPLTALNQNSKILETCTEREIPLHRAIWFLKCVGVHDMRPQKAAPTIEQNQNTSKDWTKIVIAYLFDQINSLGSDRNIRKSGGNQPKEEMFRSALKKLEYLIQLCRLQYDENLLCRHDFLRQSVLLFQKATHLNQLPALICIARTFLDEFCRSRFFAKLLANQSISQMQKLKQMLPYIPAAKPVLLHLTTLVQNIFLLSPEIFVSSVIWKNSLPIRFDLFSTERLSHFSLSQATDIIATEKAIEKRVVRLFPSLKPKEPLDPLLAILLEVRSIVFSNVDGFTLSHTEKDLSALFEYGSSLQNLDTIYAAAWLLALKSDRKKLQQFLFSYLEDYILRPKSNRTFKHCLTLFRVLEDFGLFSYPSFLRFAATKEVFSSSEMIEKLSSFSIRNVSSSFMSERAIFLSEIAQSESDQLASVKSLVIVGIPSMFSPDFTVFLNLQEPTKTSFDNCNANIVSELELLKTLSSLRPFLQMQIAVWIRDSLYMFIVHPQTIGINNWKTLSVPGTSVLNGRQFCMIISILETMKDYHTLLEICVWLMGKTFDYTILRSIAYVLQRHSFKYISLGYSSLIFTTIWKKYIFDQEKFHIFPSLLSSIKLFNEHSSEKKDFSFLVKKPANPQKKSTVDFSYLKDLSPATLSKISLKVVSECTSVEIATGLWHQFLDTFQNKFTSHSNTAFAVDLYCGAYALLQAQQAGSYLEDAIYGYLLRVFVTIPVDEKKMPNATWFFELLTSLIAHQGVPFVSVVSDIIIPIFRNPNLFNNGGKGSLLAAGRWLSVLGTLLTGNQSTFLPDHIYHLERTQSIKTFQASVLSSKGGEAAIYSLLVCFQSLITEGQSLQKPPEMINSLAVFLESMTSNASWFREHFSLGLASKYTSLLSGDGSLNIHAKCKVLLSLLSTPLFSPSVPRSVEHLKQSILATMNSLPRGKALVFVFIFFEIAQLFKQNSESGWQDVFTNLLDFMLHNSVDLPFLQISQQYADQWREPFLGHVEELKKHLKKLNLFFIGTASLERATPFCDVSSLNHYLKVSSIMIQCVFGSASALAKDDARKSLKKTLLELANVVLGQVVQFQSHQQMFELLKYGVVNLFQAASAAGREELKNCVHFQTVGLDDIVLIFRLYVGVMQSLIRYVVELQEELNSVPFFQATLLLCCSKFVVKNCPKSIQDGLFDLALVMSDEITKNMKGSKEMGQWVIEKYVLIVQDENTSRIHTLLPFSEKMTLLKDLYQTIPATADGSPRDEASMQQLLVAPAETGNARPWEWIERGNVASTEASAVPSTCGTSASLLNDTAISLSFIGARKVRPRRQTFESLFEYGWRPSTTLIDDTSMIIDATNDPLALDADILSMAALTEASPKADALTLEKGEEIGEILVESENNSPGESSTKKRPAESSLDGGRAKKK